MDYPLLMRLIEGVGDLGGVLEQQRDRQRATQQSLRQRLAFQVFHYQEVSAVVMANVVKRTDVGMRKPRDAARLKFEALARFRVRGHLAGENLNRDCAA